MKTANVTLTLSLLALACTVALSPGVAAQNATEKPPVPTHSGMDHSKMDHSKMDHGKMDHSKMNHAEQAVDHSQTNPSDMDHSQMDHSGMDHSKMGHAEQAVDHSQMDHSEVDHSKMDHTEMNHSEMTHAEQAVDHSSMDHSTMNHADMQMQGGKAPANARDPHAYSNGYTLTDGPYGMADSRHLKHGVEHPQWSVLGNRLEYNADSEAGELELQAWYGTTYDRLVLKTEAEVSDGKLEESSTEQLWSHAIAAYWDGQLGLRLDQVADGTNRQWLALGVQGLAPYWFEVDVTAYLGTGGRTALSAEAEYELLLTQRLILQARAELTAYGKDDEVNQLGKGLSSLGAGLRLRYEFSRQFAPYVGVEWHNKYGNTADFARLQDASTAETSWVAGVRFWF